MKALAILFTVAAVGFDVSRAIADDSLRPYQQLQTRIPLDIDEMPLEAALNFISGATGLDITLAKTIDKDVLAVPVSIHGRETDDISAKAALTAILAPLHLTFRLRDARIVVLDDDGTADHETHHYDLATYLQDAAFVRLALDTIITPPQLDPGPCGPLVVVGVPGNYSFEMTGEGVHLWAHPELHEQFGGMLKEFARIEAGSE